LSPPLLRWRDGNQIALLRNGVEFFPALFLAIENAETSIHLETYIFNLDQTGLALLDHLAAARARGVKVRVLIDGFGSNGHAQELMERMSDAGIVCRVYRPEPQGLRAIVWDSRRLRRMHRKTAVVDGRIAFVGGINILDDFHNVPYVQERYNPRFDFAVRVEGPLLQDIESLQWRLWLRMAWRKREDWGAFYRRLAGWRRRFFVSRRTLHRVPDDAVAGMRATLLQRDNLRFRKTIENVYVADIRRASRDVIIANAYFFPGRRLLRALKAATLRGVRVRLLVQGHSEYPMQYRAGRHMYQRLLSAGIEIYEYKASYLHAKVAVIDDRAMVGSANLDPFSLLLAREANVYVDDIGFSSTLAQALQAELVANVQAVTSEFAEGHGWMSRCLDSVAYFLLRVGVAMTGKAADY
jgi:cardiolipin synthase